MSKRWFLTGFLLSGFSSISILSVSCIVIRSARVSLRVFLILERSASPPFLFSTLT